MKPENFAIGRKTKSNIIYIIDFGLAKRYRDVKSNKHIPFKEGKSLTGTARYASINTHKGYEESRRDDLEGMLYVLIYFLKGCLPWQGLAAKTKDEKYNKIKQTKIETNLDKLCNGLPGNKFIYYRRD